MLILCTIWKRSHFAMVNGDVSTYSLGRSFSFALILISSLILGRVGNINVKNLLIFISLLDESLVDDLVLLVSVDSFGLHKLRNWRQLFTRSRQSPILFQRKNFRWNDLKLTFVHDFSFFPLKMVGKVNKIFTACYHYLYFTLIDADNE